ncbi:MAG: hypothetical protein IJ737_04210 [Ruminococcus sp.]|nr:hypothetical protein [Ruminococcus sp.]
MKILKHIVIVFVSLFLLLGVPYMTTPHFKALMSGEEPDAVTSASRALDKPSGEYVVLINKDRRKNEDTLKFWEDFFSGEEVGFVFEDIECRVPEGDTAGLKMAESFMSRLPENQMKVKSEDGMMLLSKAEYGMFDIIIMSAETADGFTASTLYDNEGVEAIFVKGENDEEV